MNKLYQSLHDRLPLWLAEWLDIFVPVIEVAIIGFGAWLLMRVARLISRRLTTRYGFPVKVASLFLRSIGVLVYGGAVLWSLERADASATIPR